MMSISCYHCRLGGVPASLGNVAFLPGASPSESTVDLGIRGEGGRGGEAEAIFPNVSPSPHSSLSLTTPFFIAIFMIHVVSL